MTRAAARAPAARRERHGEILVAARDLFCERGYDAASMADIAARIGVVEGTLYKYFESKRALLLAVLEHWYAEMFADYARDLAGLTDTRARLRLLVWRHLRSVRDFPQLCALMFREIRPGPEYIGSGLHASNRRYTQLLLDVLAQGQRQGELRDDLPVALLRDMIYGGIEHHSWNYLSGRGGLDIDRLADQLVGVVCDGVALREPALQRETARLSRIVARIERNFAADPKPRRSARR